MLSGLLLSLAAKLWFFDRMVWLYGDTAAQNSKLKNWPSRRRYANDDVSTAALGRTSDFRQPSVQLANVPESDMGLPAVCTV